MNEKLKILKIQKNGINNEPSSQFCIVKQSIKLMKAQTLKSHNQINILKLQINFLWICYNKKQLRQIDREQNRYLNHGIENPDAKFQLNKVGRNVYKHTSRCLGKLYEIQNTQNNKQFKQIKSMLQESLGKIQEFLFENEKQLMEIRTKIQLSVLEIQDYNMQTLQKCDNLITIYNHSKNLRAFQTQNDFFLAQQQFLNCAKQQLDTQRGLGDNIVKYLEFSEQKQIEKLAVLKKLIGNYIDSTTTETNLPPQHLSNLRDILYKNTQSKYLQEYFSVQQLLSKQLIYELSNEQHKHQSQITIKFLKNFLKKFQYDQFDNRNLILKMLNVYLKTQNNLQVDPRNSGNGQTQSLVQVELLITVDGFINLYQSPSQLKNQDQSEKNQSSFGSTLFLNHLLKAPLYTMKIGGSLEFNKISDIELEINVKKWGLMGFSQNGQYSINLIFISEDQREEFIQFVGQLR